MSKSPEEEHPRKAFGWAARDSSGVLSPFKFSRRATGDQDVTFKVLYCGVCHSDLHCVKNEWGISSYPLLPGHCNRGGESYAKLYPREDLVYTVGTSNYSKNWFFAHVDRKIGNGTYQPTTWQIKFKLDKVTTNPSETYMLRVAIASATGSQLQVRFNNPNVSPQFTTSLIGTDNAIARHGIHGLYWLYNIEIKKDWLAVGENVIYLTQSRHLGPFQGLMYDYIRLEGPST